MRGGTGGFAGTLYDGGWVVQQLHDKVFTVCAAQAGTPLSIPLACSCSCSMTRTPASDTVNLTEGWFMN